jgi:hypothetical protein
MKKIPVILIVAFLLLPIQSCIDGLHCIRGNGIMETETRRTDSFRIIENSTSIDVVFKKGESTSVKIEAEENIIDYIVTETFNNRLEIKTRDGNTCLDFSEKPLITITSPEINSAYLTGSGDLFADEMSGSDVMVNVSGSSDVSVTDVQCTILKLIVSGSGSIKISECHNQSSELTISGSGNIDLSGQGSTSSMKISGSGDISAENLLLTTASISILGSGNVFTTISQSLYGIISGSGNIYLRGNPTITQNISGSGRIIKY